VGEIYRGIRHFVSHLKEYLGDLLPLFSVDSNSSVELYRLFIESPFKGDAEILKSIYFADLFGGKKDRYLISNLSSEGLAYKEYIIDSWWKEGAIVLASVATSPGSTPNHGSSLPGFIKRNFLKLIRNPSQVADDFVNVFIIFNSRRKLRRANMKMRAR
jgi:hypothetical protein